MPRGTTGNFQPCRSVYITLDMGSFQEADKIIVRAGILPKATSEQIFPLGKGVL